MRDKDLHAELWLETESSLQGVGRGLQRATGLLRAAKTVALTVLRGFCKGRGPRRAQTGSGRGQVQEGSRSQGPGVSSPMTTPLVYFINGPQGAVCAVCAPRLRGWPGLDVDLCKGPTVPSRPHSWGCRPRPSPPPGHRADPTTEVTPGHLPHLGCNSGLQDGGVSNF